jgi:hypothetical protein
MLKKALSVPIPRRSRRITTRWPARYMAPGDERWIDCSIIDLSLGGAALEMPMPDREPQGRVALELDSVDAQPVGLRLLGTVCYWDGTADGHLRVGIEFEQMTNLERYKLANLVSRQRRTSP